MRLPQAAWFASTLAASFCPLACSMNDDGIMGSGDDDSSATLNGGNSGVTPAGCGNGELTEDEACDDGNRTDGDGCAANCLSVEIGFSCPTPGKACIAIALCGDGVIVAPEQCDDGNKADGDGCSTICKYEPGYKCDGTPSVCTATVCGDGVPEGAENCEDGNNLPFDGCSEYCQIEPNCSNGACTSTCGDGVVVGEACDDGNNLDGDGCSSTCTVETGYECSGTLGDVMKVPMVVRDFNAGGDFEKGSTFATNLNFANQGLLSSTLEGAKRKPVLASTTGTYNGQTGKASGIASAESFAQWYDETAASAGNTYNGIYIGRLNLYLNDAGTAYVNRFGVNGDGSTAAKYQRTTTQNCVSEAQVAYDSSGNVMPCYACYYDSDTSTPECDNGTNGAQACTRNGVEPDSCALVNGQYVGTFIDASFDGNPLFFPADAISPYSPSGEGQISGNYDPSWTKITGTQHNFSFTTEVRYWFMYDPTLSYSLRFIGDDDVWVFINNRLAVDLGGIHTAVQGDLTLSSAGASVTVIPTNESSYTPITSTPDLAMEANQVYEIVVLHAERQTTASSYQLTLSGFSASASFCKADCGDGIIELGEQCDDGINDGGYGECSDGCVLTEYCGDGVLQEEYEDCDDGNNVDGDDCGSGCRNVVIY